MSHKDNKAAIDWFFDGERGSSSETICRAFLGKLPGDHDCLPVDTDDLARCRLFLDALTEDGKTAALLAVRLRYADWIPLVRDWDSVCASMDDECPVWRTDLGRRWGKKTTLAIGLLAVEGYRLRYPNADIRTCKDGTLSSMTNGESGPDIAVIRTDFQKKKKP